MPFQFRKEAIEEDLNTNFPSQGQGNPPLYYSLSEVVVPTYSINSVAEGSEGNLQQNLREAWDFSTGNFTNDTTTWNDVITNTGFWKVDLTYSGYVTSTSGGNSGLAIYDGTTRKFVWDLNNDGGVSEGSGLTDGSFVVFLRSGDKLQGRVYSTGDARINVWYRQIADVNGNLVNPLGFSFA